MAETQEIKIVSAHDFEDRGLKAAFEHFEGPGLGSDFKLTASSGLYFCTSSLNGLLSYDKHIGFRGCSMFDPETRRVHDVIFPDDPKFIDDFQIAFNALGTVLSTSLPPHMITSAFNNEKLMHLKITSSLYLHLGWRGIQSIEIAGEEDLDYIKPKLTEELLKAIAAEIATYEATRRTEPIPARVES